MNFQRVVLFLLLLYFGLVSKGVACDIDENGTPVLVFPPKFDSKTPENDYVFQLIQLILKKSEGRFGPCQAKLLEYKLSVKRMEYYLEKQKDIHVIALTVNTQRDKRFLPVPIPIKKGLMGYRLLIIRKGEEERFAGVKNLRDLSRMIAGQGVGWSDAEILGHNNLNVLTAGNVGTLMDMLIHSRFDYFPRGALQISTELETHQNKPVVMEQGLLLRYPNMTALYVNAHNLPLAERLRYGLKTAFQDGSFEQFFNSHPSSIAAMQNINLDKRKVLNICNPILPGWVPVNNGKFWLEPWPDKYQEDACHKSE